MAIDQAILESSSTAGVGLVKPTLRFYGWSEPTLSLGYFQGLNQRSKHVASQSLAAVRRSTGGGAIVHDRELTYSLVVPRECQPKLLERASAIGAVPEFYDAMHQAIIDSLAELGCRSEMHGVSDHEVSDHNLESNRDANTDGLTQERSEEPFLCFQRRSSWDIVASGYKIVGSAQRRVRGSVLQHGSVLLSSSPSAPQLPGASDLVSTRVASPDLSRAVVERLAERLRIRWIGGSLEPNERALASQIREQRFADAAWLARR